MDGQVSGLGTVHPLLTLSFVSTWILPLHVVSSTLKRKSSSSVMDGLQRRRRKRIYLCICKYMYVHNDTINVLSDLRNTAYWIVINKSLSETAKSNFEDTLIQ